MKQLCLLRIVLVAGISGLYIRGVFILNVHVAMVAGGSLTIRQNLVDDRGHTWWFGVCLLIMGVSDLQIHSNIKRSCDQNACQRTISL